MTNSKLNENRPGYKKTKVGWIPEEWEVALIGECAEVFFSNVDKKSEDNELPVKLCNYTNVYYNDIIMNSLDFMRATATKAEVEKFSLKKGDVIITKDSESADDIAVPAYVIENLDNVLCGYHLAFIRPNSNILFGEYLSKFFQLHTVKHYFSTLANGVTRFGLTTQSTLNAQLSLPPPPEQKKIAEILSAWDRAIEQVGKLIEAKTKHKKALMQQLLTGKRRFKAFKQIEWKKMKLHDFLKPSSRPVPRPDKKYLALGIRSHGKGTFLRTVDNPEDVMMDTLYEVKENDLIVNITFAWEGAIAIVKKSDEGALVSHRFPIHLFKTDKVIPEYFRHVILTKLFVHKLRLISPGGAGRNRVMSKKDLLNLSVNIPRLPEQQKIAAVLNKLIY